MVHKTKGIVLRTVKYGETSIIVSIYTALYGLQSYLVNGVRISSKKTPALANMFQPAAILDLVIYHNELKHLQRLKEFKWHFLYEHIYFDVVKNAVALFMVELLHKCLKQPEGNIELYAFVENAFIGLDDADEAVVGNYCLFFALHLALFFGLRIHDNFSEKRPYLDLQEGVFVESQPRHPHFLEGELSAVTSQLLKTIQPNELRHIKLNQDKRRMLLLAYQNFYALHNQDFGALKTLPVLQAILA